MVLSFPKHVTKVEPIFEQRVVLFPFGRTKMQGVEKKKSGHGEATTHALNRETRSKMKT
jgi:hypothetical protein